MTNHMKKPCSRCGYCCTQYLVTIIVDPKLGPSEDNARSINLLEEGCPHLKGSRPGEYLCRIHGYKWFRETPCGKFNADGCRLGGFIIKRFMDKEG